LDQPRTGRTSRCSRRARHDGFSSLAVFGAGPAAELYRSAVSGPVVSAGVPGGCTMMRSCIRHPLATLMGVGFVLALTCVLSHQPATGAQPESKKPDLPSARKVAVELVGRTDDGSASGPLGVTVAGDYAYLAAWRRGLRVVNVSNPKKPKEVGGCRIQGNAKDVVVAGGYAFVAALEGGLRVLDLTSPASPKEVGLCRVRGEAVAVIVAGPLAYVADGYMKDEALFSS